MTARSPQRAAIPSVDRAAMYTRAVAVLHKAAGPAGFYASSEFEHYFSVWGRDASLTLLGAIHTEDPVLLQASRDSLLTLMKRQYADGQITDVYWPNGVPETNNQPYWDCGETGATDATALFVIAAGAYLGQRAREGKPDDQMKTLALPRIDRALDWLAARDDNKIGLIDSPEAGDWMDSSFVRSGKLLYNNVLLYRALRVGATLRAGEEQGRRYGAAADRLKEKINFAFWPEKDGKWIRMVGSIWGEDGQPQWQAFPHPAMQSAYAAAYKSRRSYYLSHIRWGEFTDKCDVLANVLAVLFDVAEGDRARQIMRSLYAASQKMPYPIATYLEPVAASDPSRMYKRDSDKHQGRAWRNPPGRYHNAGIWPFIGGFYVVALLKCGMVKEAEHELTRLTAANLRKVGTKAVGFNECLNYYSGRPQGADGQAWSAGAFIAAHQALSGKDVSF